MNGPVNLGHYDRSTQLPCHSFDCTKRLRWCLFFLYWLPALLACAWVLSLPVFPSQDGPLHLYYVNILRQLLAHERGVYAETYYIKSFVTPYSLYYYGLLTLGHFISLEMADKIIVCLYLVAFAGAMRSVLRAISGDATYSAFLCLPILLNWPLMMGFINYSLSMCLALFALAAWCGRMESTRWRPRTLFLLMIALMMVTHPIPWLLVVTFACLEFAIRETQHVFAASWRVTAELRRDLLTLALACLPYFYFHQFSQTVQTIEPALLKPNATLARMLPPQLLTYADRALSFLYTLGIDVFAGGAPLPRLYRGTIALLLLTFLCGGIWSLRRSQKARTWTLSNTWAVFSVGLLPFLLFLPDPLQGRYFFAARMGVFFFIGCVASVAVLLRERQKLATVLAFVSYAATFLSLGLALRYISPAARGVATVWQAPLMPAILPGLVIWPPGRGAAPGLNYIPDNWAAASYFRLHNLVLYNTAWLGDPIILLGVQPRKLQNLDASYFESVPWYGSQLLLNEAATRRVLSRVGFVMAMRQNAPEGENPLATKPGSLSAGSEAAGWSCFDGEAKAWYLCQRSSGLPH